MSRVRGVLGLGESADSEGRDLADTFAVPFCDARNLESARPKQLEEFIRDQIKLPSDATAYVFLASPGPLCLLQLSRDGMLNLSADLANTTLNYRRLKGGGKQQMLAKAVGLHATSHPRVLDATAGLGRDAFILASLGASVRMVERAPEIRVLLKSALEHARALEAKPSDDFAQTISRLSLEAGDAIDCLARIAHEERPDVIYLDPMFPPRQKSALVKKEMRILHDLVGLDPDADRLLEAAQATGVRRIVVKRPRIAPALSEAKPNYVLTGKTNRFDVYLNP